MVTCDSCFVAGVVCPLFWFSVLERMPGYTGKRRAYRKPNGRRGRRYTPRQSAARRMYVRKRSYVARRNRYWSNRQSLALTGRGTLFPEKLYITAVTYFSWRGAGTLTGIDSSLLYYGAVLGATANTGIILNSYYNPTGETSPAIYHQPQYYATFAAIYQQYIVKYASLTTELLNSNTANFVYVFLIQKGGTSLPSSDFDNIQAQPYTVKRFLKGFGSGDGTMTRVRMGLNPRVKQALSIDQDVFSDIDANPVDLVNFRIFGKNMSTNSDYTINVTMKLVQKVLLARTDPVPVQNS